MSCNTRVESFSAKLFFLTNAKMQELCYRDGTKNTGKNVKLLKANIDAE